MAISARSNAGKLEWCLFPFEAAEEIVKVLTYGARKYAVGNWEKGCPWTDTYNSLLRHLVAWRSGEDYDPETKLLHLGQIGCNVVFLLMYQLKSWGKDDRRSPILRNLGEKNGRTRRRAAGKLSSRTS